MSAGNIGSSPQYVKAAAESLMLSSLNSVNLRFSV